MQPLAVSARSVGGGGLQELRLLVVVSGDFGELGAALNFLQGLATSMPPAWSALVLLPTPLGHAMPIDCTQPWRVYGTLADIQRSLVEYRPNTVLLATGYLLTVDTGLTALDVLRLLQRLRRLGVTLLTTDPFLGVRPWPTLPQVGDLRQPAGRLAFALSCYLIGLCSRVWAMRLALRKAWQVYPAPTARLPTLAGQRRLSYCSDHAAAAGTAPGAVLGDRPIWLFVLSRVDYALLVQAHGPDHLKALHPRLAECLALGRHAVVVGPAELVADIESHFSDRDQLSVFSNLSHSRYLGWLMVAEYAFFWNLLSFSLIHRVLAGRPVFFFDPGHFATLFPAVAQAGQRLFYGGWRPPLRRLDQPFDLQQLAHAAAATTQAFTNIGEGLRSGMTPAELLRIARSDGVG